MLDEVYKTVPETPMYDLEPVLSEDEVRQRMSDITRRSGQVRQKLREAYEQLMKREATAQAAVLFLAPELLTNADAKKYLTAVKEGGVKMTDEKSKWLVKIETEDVQESYNLAKFDCDTSDKDFAKLEPQLMFYQSLMKLR